MTVNIPRVWQEIRLAEYAPEFEGQTIRVWVNPPSRVTLELGQILSDKAEERLAGWLAQVWEEWSEAEIQTLLTEAMDTDPALGSWLVRETIQKIGDWRSGKKKV